MVAGVVMRTIFWLVRAFVFFTLFAFAVNNQQSASVRWFFGQEWRAPMVFIVLAAFGLGCALGVFAMVPSWWRHRRVARLNVSTRHLTDDGTASGAAAPATLEHPPRDGL
jgi:lipopolysaccharide assembly protein A